MEIMRIIMALILSLSTFNIFVSSTNHGVNTRISSDSTEILSRKRRFFLARSNGWLVRTSFDAIIPFEDNGGPLLLSLSLLYDIDSGKYVYPKIYFFYILMWLNILHSLYLSCLSTLILSLFLRLFPTPADQLGEKRRSDGDRSFKDQDHRSQTLEIIEKYLNRMGGVVGNGHACVLRAICEVIFVSQIRSECHNLTIITTATNSYD